MTDIQLIQKIKYHQTTAVYHTKEATRLIESYLGAESPQARKGKSAISDEYKARLLGNLRRPKKQ